jgi:hypothetical protein
LILITVGSPSAWASRSIYSKFLTAYPSADGSRLTSLPSAPNHCGACHFDFDKAKGNNLNPYGDAIDANGKSSDEILAIGWQDSDGDGFSNDDEIKGTGFTNIPTFPGLTPSNVSDGSGVTPSELTGFLVPVAAEECASDDDCDDELYCNGVESCSIEASDTVGVCAEGTDPCAGDICLEDSEECVDCEEDSDCAEGEICEDDVCIDDACPPGTPEEVLLFDEDGDCLLNKDELKKYKDSLKTVQKAEKTALKAKQSLEKDKYKLIKTNYSE